MDLQLVADRGVSEDLALQKEKGTYTKDEVKNLLSKKRIKESLKSLGSLPNTISKYLLISSANGVYELSLVNRWPYNTLELGRIEVMCSDSPEELFEFTLRPVFNGI